MALAVGSWISLELCTEVLNKSLVSIQGVNWDGVFHYLCGCQVSGSLN